MKKQLIFAAATVIGVAGGLYLASSGGETPTVPVIDFTQVEDMREGDMLKLQLGADRGSGVVFTHQDGAALTLAAFEGKFVVLNFWATWCAPCRKEMPSLNKLQTKFGGDNFKVITIATGHNPIPAIKNFFKKEDITELPILLDPKQELVKKMSIFGLPSTIILDPRGREIARLRGDAEWADENAFVIIKALIATEHN